MTELVLFHHVQGLTEGVRSFAERIRDRGHTVHTPDLFEGQTFGSIEEGLAHVREIGFDAVPQRAEEACADLPDAVVYGGFSLGVMAAQRLLQHRPGALGGLLLHSFVEPGELGGAWPDGVPVQLHGMDHDPFLVDDGDLAAARRAEADHPNLEIHLYPGSGHLFTDLGSPDFDPAATEEVLTHALRLLDAAAPPRS